MQKLILISIVVMTVALPVAAAREPRPFVGLRRAVWWMLAAILCYILALLLVYPRTLG